MAFCMDSWVRKGIPDDAIPDKVGIILKKLDARPSDMFPFNFLNYVQSTLSRQINSFVQMFSAYLDESSKEELQIFARGTGTTESSMHIKILDAFESLKKQQNSLHNSVNSLKVMIQQLENKPKDSSYDEEIKELKGEGSFCGRFSTESPMRNFRLPEKSMKSSSMNTTAPLPLPSVSLHRATVSMWMVAN